MNQKENGPEDQLLDSDYDGIREYDNDLPNWWLTLFFATLAFSVFYLIYRGLTGVTAAEILAITEQEIESARQQALASGDIRVEQVTEEVMIRLVSDKNAVEKGKKVFITRCSACHGQNGEGGIGPNLTDKYWIHGGGIMNIRNTIENGVLDKGMLSWQGVLPPDEISEAAVFVKSLSGTNPDNPKAPQGTPVE